MNSGKWTIGSLVVALLFVMSVSTVEAGPWGFGSRRQESWQSDLQPARQGSESEETQEEKEPHHPRHDGKQRHRRLSPEEHFQLRRDIKDAGKEIYPDHDER